MLYSEYKSQVLCTVVYTRIPEIGRLVARTPEPELPELATVLVFTQDHLYLSLSQIFIFRKREKICSTLLEVCTVLTVVLGRFVSFL